MSGRRALVTGATGFVGQALVDRLVADGWSVRALLHRQVEQTGRRWHDSVVVDLADGQVPGEATRGIDVVFHLAGKAHAVAALRETDSEYAVNTVGTTALLHAARAEGVGSFVYVSSVKAAELDSPYGRSKRQAEEAVLATRPGPGTRVCVVRPVLVYGPGVKGNLERMIDAVDRGRFPPLAESGNRRSMVHVLDLVESLILCATSEAGDARIYVVTDGRPYSTRDLYVEMAHALGRRVCPWSVPVGLVKGAGKVGDLVGRVAGRRILVDSTLVERLLGSAEYDAAPIRSELGFRPARDLPSSLPEMVAARQGRRPA